MIIFLIFFTVIAVLTNFLFFGFQYKNLAEFHYVFLQWARIAQTRLIVIAAIML